VKEERRKWDEWYIYTFWVLAEDVNLAVGPTIVDGGVLTNSA
jgi:hypothetical protein